MTQNTGCFVVLPADGRRIDLGDFEMVVKADTRRQVESCRSWRRQSLRALDHRFMSTTMPPKPSTVLQGEYVMNLDGDEHRCPAGSFIFIPAGIAHGFRVGDLPSRKLNFYFPAAMIGYFDALASALARSDVTDQALAGIAEAHHMHIVGPASEQSV